MCESTPNIAPEGADGASSASVRLHVAVGILQDDAGRVLIARRPIGKHLAGLWEFPGGKFELGEGPATALARELAEELGISVIRSEPFGRVQHSYPDRMVILHVRRVVAFTGVPHGLEGQALAWVRPEALGRWAMPQANRAVSRAILLPKQYLITPDRGQQTDFLATIEQALASGIRLIRLRLPSADEELLRRRALQVSALCRQYGGQLLLSGEPALVEACGAHGVHLASRALLAAQRRPLPMDRWVGASCHDAVQLAHAHRLGLDFAVLSPVRATVSHPERAPLGWRHFATLASSAGLPVFALGGVGPDDLRRAHRYGVHGVAGIDAFWPSR